MYVLRHLKKHHGAIVDEKYFVQHEDFLTTALSMQNIYINNRKII